MPIEIREVAFRFTAPPDPPAGDASSGRTTHGDLLVVKTLDPAASAVVLQDVPATSWQAGAADAGGGPVVRVFDGAGEFPYIVSFQDATFDSAHAGGVNAVLGDGSVRGVSLGVGDVWG